MVERLRSLGLPGVTARTFHAHALSQLRHFWPRRPRWSGHSRTSSIRSCRSSAASRASLPGHYRFTPSKDLADEIEWAKSRRIAPTAYEREAVAAHREPPIPVDLFVRIFSDYERAKVAGQSDRLRRPAGRDGRSCSRPTRRRPRPSAPASRWFSVDEYQDTNPLQQRLLELWLGDRRRPVRRRRRGPDDLHVHRRDVGLPDRVRGAPSGRPRDHAVPQLPIVTRDPRARQSTAGVRGPSKAADRHDAGRAGTLDPGICRRRR